MDYQSGDFFLFDSVHLTEMALRSLRVFFFPGLLSTEMSVMTPLLFYTEVRMTVICLSELCWNPLQPYQKEKYTVKF